MRKVYISTHETVVNRHLLAELERKAEAHDAYVTATKGMADRWRTVREDGSLPEPYRRGYQDSLTTFCRLVVDA